jgi:hypothetical protein
VACSACLSSRPFLVERGRKHAPPLPPEKHDRKMSLGGVSRMSTHVCCELSRAKQVEARDVGSRRDFQSILAHALSLVRIDMDCACYYSGVCGMFFFFFFFGFSFLIQRPLSCSSAASRHFASLGRQGAARRGAFLCV